MDNNLDTSKVILPSIQIRLDLMKQYVKVLNKNVADLERLRRRLPT